MGRKAREEAENLHRWRNTALELEKVLLQTSESQRTGTVKAHGN
jgi:hypothetical protein